MSYWTQGDADEAARQRNREAWGDKPGEFCPTCDGTGMVDDGHEVEGGEWIGWDRACDTCDGKGLVPPAVRAPNDGEQTT